jgi:hypothetical protein
MRDYPLDFRQPFAQLTTKARIDYSHRSRKMNPLMKFIEWWSGLSSTIRLAVPLVILTISLLVLILGNRIIPLGWGLGFVLLFFSGRSKQEKDGYGDYW